MFQDTRPAAPGAGGAHEAWAEFRIDDAAELLHLLQRLCDGGVPLSLSAPQGAALHTRLSSVDAAQRRIAFSAGAHADSVQLQRLAHDGEAVAVACLDEVKLQFDADDLVLVHAPCALHARLPAVLYRFQRRAAYRVRSFEPRAPQALLRHPSMPEMRIGLRIVDLSAGGCALRLPDDIPALQPGTLLAGVRIDLDGDSAFEATLRLQHVSAMHGGSGQRLGCEFVALDGPARRALQRWIDQTQQRRRLRAMR